MIATLDCPVVDHPAWCDPAEHQDTAPDTCARVVASPEREDDHGMHIEAFMDRRTGMAHVVLSLEEPHFGGEESPIELIDEWMSADRAREIGRRLIAAADMIDPYPYGLVYGDSDVPYKPAVRFAGGGPL